MRPRRVKREAPKAKERDEAPPLWEGVSDLGHPVGDRADEEPKRRPNVE